MTPSFSVIIPAYNAEHYVREAIDSALSQTHMPVEILVVDDGSTDETPEIVRSYDSTVQLIQQENQGPGAARNRGAKVAFGDWLAFLDADDVWEPSKLEKQSATIQHSTGIVYCDRINMGQLGGLSTRQSDGVKLHAGRIYDQLLLEGNFITLSSACIERKFFNDLGGFDPTPEVAGVEDWELWLRASKLRDTALVQTPLVRYRCHVNGISKNVQKMFRAQETVLDRVLVDAPRSTRRDARSRSAMISAWFSLNSGQYADAAQLYGRALCMAPLNIEAWKGIVKSLIRRRSM